MADRDIPYEILRPFTLPVAAVTVSARGEWNGLIVNSAQRASLVPHVPRLSLYISKPNASHDILMRSGLFGVHLLRRDQFDLIERLGLRSRREDADKMTGLKWVPGETGLPLLEDCIAGFECRVVNAMDAGAATFFLGEVVSVHHGREGEIMTSDFFRDNAPERIRSVYAERLKQAQEYLAPLAETIEPDRWSGPTDPV
ncbi:MAG: flavin reductase family protein [Gemmatimonadota bacterium]